MMSGQPLFPSPVRPDADLPEQSGRAGTLCIAASLTNLREIERAWGSRPVLAVRHVVLKRARELCRSVSGIAVLSGDVILFVFDSPLDGLPPAASDLAQIGLLLDRILCDLADQPVKISGDAVFVTLSLSVVEQAEGAFDAAAPGAGADVAQPGREEEHWRERFLVDMKAAEKLFSAKRLDHLVFDAESVRNLGHAGIVRYYKVVPFWTWHGVRQQVAEMVAPLARLGLVRRLDRWAVEATLGALHANPDLSLGCNVTSHSASLDAWWTLIIAQLSEQRAVAQRLVIELSDVPPATGLETVSAFVRKLQALGCQVALDNVGGGGGSIEALASLGADIVKIGAGCLREARASDRAADFLRNLVALARSTGADVVITGAEDEADVEIAEFVGATLIQGPCFKNQVPEILHINCPN